MFNPLNLEAISHNTLFLHVKIVVISCPVALTKYLEILVKGRKAHLRSQYKGTSSCWGKYAVQGFRKLVALHMHTINREVNTVLGY